MTRYNGWNVQAPYDPHEKCHVPAAKEFMVLYTRWRHSNIVRALHQT